MAANEVKKTVGTGEEKKVTSVTVSDEYGNKYKLQFNSRVVKNMERRGFKVDLDYPMSCIDDLFLGAFQMNCKGMTPERARKIWNFQKKKDELLSLLVQLYMQPFQELMAEPEDNGDPTWETE